MVFKVMSWTILRSYLVFLGLFHNKGGMHVIKGLLGGSIVKNPPPTGGDNMGSFPGLGTSPGEGNGNPLQYSYLGIPMDRGAWRALVHRVARVGQD